MSAKKKKQPSTDLCWYGYPPKSQCSHMPLPCSCTFVGLMGKAAAGCGGEPVWEAKENAEAAVETL